MDPKFDRSIGDVAPSYRLTARQVEVRGGYMDGQFYDRVFVCVCGLGHGLIGSDYIEPIVDRFVLDRTYLGLPEPHLNAPLMKIRGSNSD